MTKTLLTIAVTLSALVMVGLPSAAARDVTFEDRVRAQDAVERVYWNQRIWPAQNPQPSSCW
jgi:hypothetical protein